MAVAGKASAEQQPAEAEPAREPKVVGGSTRHPPPIAWECPFLNPAHNQRQRLCFGLRETHMALAGLGCMPQMATGSCTQESETPGSAAGPVAEPELP